MGDLIIQLIRILLIIFFYCSIYMYICIHERAQITIISWRLILVCTPIIKVVIQMYIYVYLIIYITLYSFLIIFFYSTGKSLLINALIITCLRLSLYNFKLYFKSTLCYYLNHLNREPECYMKF